MSVKIELSGGKKLYLWNSGYFKTYVKIKGIPRSIEVMIQDTPDKNGSPGEWALYSAKHDYPPTGEKVFPKELYLQIPASHKITFDFLGWNEAVKIVSEAMLQFLNEQGLTEGYELGSLTVVSKKEEVIETEKKYFALRFFRFDEDLLDFGNREEVEVKNSADENRKIALYPNMRIKEGVDKKIFVLDDFDYYHTFNQSLIFTEEIKVLIEERKFVACKIYAMDELHKAIVPEKKVYPVFPKRIKSEKH